MSEPASRATAAVGLLVLIGIAWLCSSDRRRVPWRVVGVGLGLQLVLAALLLRTGPGRGLFVGVNDAVNQLVAYTEAGSRFVFGPLKEQGFSFALDVLPVIVFMGSLFGVLYHVGLVQRLVALLARALSRTMGTSGAESLAAVANIFVGMTEAPLLVRPYIESMTRSELFTLMATGMATIAGSVLVAYATILGGGAFAGHLVTASLLSAPAAILLAKVMIPESETPKTADAAKAAIPIESVNVIDAASRGALAALRLAAYVGALVMAFVALIALVNGVLGALGGLVGWPELTLQRILGIAFAPFALLMGIPFSEATAVGSLLGVKTALNEFLAYQELADLRAAGGLSERSAVITSYALCGFANFGSLAILIGGIGGMAPSRRSEVAELGLRSILAGTLATLMTGCVASLLL
ncbi:MAG: nucleoside transporter C-terminal domain-containing protein [Myxococcota bacterium]|nr:nucleoside transporter C-terminal domain-containing protein [Myxococcota bacterium]